jgi:two-component system, OmpR family, copper resistance phosphate regulon response regulator CusR
MDMSARKTIFIIEDEQVVQQNLLQSLEREGFEAFAFGDAESAIGSSLLEVADAVILDIGLPGMNGWEACTFLKKQKPGLAILMATAYTDIHHRLQGFETGADDYIIKPFFIEELIARLKTILRRYELAPGARRTYEIADLFIDVKGKNARRNNAPLKLSVTEFRLLAFLAEANGTPVSKEIIIKEVWDGRYSVGENTIEVYINLLRNKIDKPFAVKLIHTKPGYGYYLSTNKV